MRGVAQPDGARPPGRYIDRAGMDMLSGLVRHRPHFEPKTAEEATA